MLKIIIFILIYLQINNNKIMLTMENYNKLIFTHHFFIIFEFAEVNAKPEISKKEKVAPKI